MLLNLSSPILNNADGASCPFEHRRHRNAMVIMAKTLLEDSRLTFRYTCILCPEMHTRAKMEFF